MKNLIIIILFIFAFVGAIQWSKWLSSKDTTIISRSGVHWHPELEIYVKEEKIEIPQNIGLVGVHNPMHTHDDLPVIHLEFNGLVREDNTRLKEFFRVWGKDFMSFGSNVKMTVNGEENIELGNYLMRDGDKIELRYE